MRAKERTLQIDTQELVPPRLVAFQKMASGMDVAGVVHEHIDGAEFGLHAVEHGMHLCLDGDIGGYTDRSANGARDFVCTGFIEIVDHNLRAFGGEAFRHRAANAVPSAGDQDYPIDESLHG